MNLINLFITGLITENVILSKFLGICPFFGNSKNTKNAIYMGLSVLFVVTISSILSYLAYKYILVPSSTEYLKTLLFILIVASLVQFLEIFFKKVIPKMHKELGIYLPLITTNCAVLGILLLNINNNYNLLEVIVYSASSSLGFTLIIYIFASIRERLDHSEIPKSFKGTPIAFVTAAIMALIFSRFTFL